MLLKTYHNELLVSFNRLNLTHVPNQDLDFQCHMSRSSSEFNDLWWEVVCFVEIGGMIDYHCLNLISVLNLIYNVINFSIHCTVGDMLFDKSFCSSCLNLYVTSKFVYHINTHLLLPPSVQKGCGDIQSFVMYWIQAKTWSDCQY